MSAVLLWFRRDLRLHDNRALSVALGTGVPVPVYVHAPAEQAPWQPGAASNWWLHHSLAALDVSLRERGTRLVIRRGPTLAALLELCSETGARSIVCNRIYEPAWLARDSTLHAALAEQGIALHSCPGALLFEPWSIKTGTGGPYKVFTPFWRNCLATGLVSDIDAAPRTLPSAPSLAGVELKSLQLLPAIDWDSAFYDHWQPGETGAQDRLTAFASHALPAYAGGRDRPALQATTGLSAALHFGELAPRRIVNVARHAGAVDTRPGVQTSVESLLRELGWREFAHHVLHHFPDTDAEPMDTRFAGFPWRRSPKRLLRAWCRGQTGFPIVDAGMRELWATGVLHNRVRMIVASFLTKHCRIHWRYGARWFWDTLVDADLPNNSFNWQWVAGSGADAAPYFRIFNPVTQSEKFDPAGQYLRRWLPELAQLPDKWLHRPWQAPPELLAQCRVRLGRDYPRPLLDLATSRDAALLAYRSCVRG